MKILVTGSRGFIASHLIGALNDQEHHVDSMDWADGVLPKVKSYDWVMHLGAISSTTEQDVDKVMRQNYDFSVELYKQCRFHGVNFQFASSASVYGLGTEFKEDSPVDPRTPYAWSKYMVERYIQQNPSDHSHAQIFRYFNVYGPQGEEHKGKQASPYLQFKQQAETNGRIKLFEGSELSRRDFVPVSRIVQMHLMFMSIDQSGVFNFGTGTTKSFLEIAETFNVPLEVIPVPKNLHHSYQTYTCADMTKTNQALDGL